MASDSHNPFAPPTAHVDDVHTSSETQPVKLWSARGRMGRLRYIAWSILGSFALMPVAAAAGFLGAATQSDGLAKVLLGVA